MLITSNGRVVKRCHNTSFAGEGLFFLGFVQSTEQGDLGDLRWVGIWPRIVGVSCFKKTQFPVT
jgi:hypothetical protein